MGGGGRFLESWPGRVPVTQTFASPKHPRTPCDSAWPQKQRKGKLGAPRVSQGAESWTEAEPEGRGPGRGGRGGSLRKARRWRRQWGGGGRGSPCGRTLVSGVWARCHQGRGQRLRKDDQPERPAGKEREGQRRGKRRVGSEEGWRKEEELGVGGGERRELGSGK